jgi:hypothetical protein
MLLGPFMLAFFVYNPERYYVPLLPAYVLFFLEWMNTKSVLPHPRPQGKRRISILCYGLLVLIISYTVQAFNYVILRHTPFRIGTEPGLSENSLFLLALPVSLSFASLVWKYREQVLSRSLMVKYVAIVLVLGAVYNIFSITDFFLRPSHALSGITRKIETIVDPDSVIAGDWAPLVVLSSKLRGLYMNQAFNHPRRVRVLRPDYFLHSDVKISKSLKYLVLDQPGVSLGQPVLEAHYNRSKVVLYPIIYESQPDEPSMGERTSGAREEAG